MDIEKFNDLVSKRISKDSDILNKEIEKEKQTVKYLYKKILHEFAEEIEQNIQSYNDILKKNYRNLNIFIYYGNNYGKKREDFYEDSIMIIFKDKDQKEPHSQTPKTNFYHLNIKIEHVRGLGEGENECFKANYFIATDYNVYEKEEFQTPVNERDKDKLINELKGFFHLFLEAFFERGYDGSLFYKKI